MTDRSTRVTYYVASSLDGFIAGADGDISWLDRVDSPGEDYGIGAFWDTVDALLMGRATWEFASNAGNPYGDIPIRVFSHRDLGAVPETVVRVEGQAGPAIHELADDGADHVWLVGGGELAAQAANERLLTDLVVSVIPVLLGCGAPLLGLLDSTVGLKLVETSSYPTGLVQLVYRVDHGGATRPSSEAS